jgi:hypothetical protein
MPGSNGKDGKWVVRVEKDFMYEFVTEVKG